MQIICGMHRGAYWIANFVVDAIKLYFVIALSIGTFYTFNLLTLDITLRI